MNRTISDIKESIDPIWGQWISCDEGWHQLIIDTDRRMRLMWPQYEIHQIKEKFGTLRFYCGIPQSDEWDSLPDQTREDIQEIMWAIEQDAERRSSAMCEKCGAFARLRDSQYWVKTLCCAHALEAGYEISEYEQEWLNNGNE